MGRLVKNGEDLVGAVGKASFVEYDNSISKLDAGNVQDAIDSILTQDSKNNTVTFTSEDDLSPTSWTDLPLLASGEKHQSIFNKISIAIKNIRWLWSKIGNTDISSIGDGTLTGGLNTLNNNLIKRTMIEQSVEVTANTGMTAYFDYSSIKGNILFSDVTWNNTLDDKPIYAIKYRSNNGSINTMDHKWNTTQTVRFQIVVLYI